jgi:uncharacterized membrane protein YhaH (DUF805 family)
MSWECPLCNNVNDDSIIRCTCGYGYQQKVPIDDPGHQSEGMPVTPPVSMSSGRFWPTDTMSAGRIWFSFTGRINRMTLWELCFALTAMILIVEFVIIRNVPEGAKIVLHLLYIVLSCYVLTSLQAKRWHDLGHSGWLAALGFVPFVNFLYVLVAIVFLFCIKGETGPNKYGSDPLQVSAASQKQTAA